MKELWLVIEYHWYGNADCIHAALSDETRAFEMQRQMRNKGYDVLVKKMIVDSVDDDNIVYL